MITGLQPALEFAKVSPQVTFNAAEHSLTAELIGMPKGLYPEGEGCNPHRLGVGVAGLDRVEHLVEHGLTHDLVASDAAECRTVPMTAGALGSGKTPPSALNLMPSASSKSSARLKWLRVASGEAFELCSHFVKECRHTPARLATSARVRPARARPARSWEPVIRMSSMEAILADSRL
jgi:hypothetical protein